MLPPLFMSKYIQLTKGLSALVDDEDYEKFGHLNWKAHKNKDKYYAKKNINKDGKFNQISLHREIMCAPQDMDVDHISGDTLDCRKQNLRLVTKSQNAINRRIRSDNKLGVVGVSRLPNGKYLAYISFNGENRRLGRFAKLEEAIEARRSAEKLYHGEYSRSENRLIEDIPIAKKENKPNQLHRKRTNNTSGATGVSYFARMKAWRARIRIDYKEITIGYFKTFKEACAAREKAEREYFPQYFENKAA
jgi:hypothetical protein